MKRFVKAFFMLPFLFLITKNISLAQEEPKLKVAAKVNINYSLQYSSDNYTIGYSPSLVLINRKQNLHRFEINDFGISKHRILYFPSSAYVLKSSNIGLRYEYLYTFLKDKKINPVLGVSLLAQYESNKYIPEQSNAFGRKFKTLSVTPGISAGLIYNINKNIFIDLFTFIEPYSIRVLQSKVYNPSVSTDLQNSSPKLDIRENFSETLNVKLGIGIKF